MMKRYCLFVFLLVFSVVLAKTQTLSEWGYPQAILKPGVKKVHPKMSKAYGTVLYSEDFDSTGNSANNGLPLGWTSTTGDGSSNLWIWSNTAPGGQYSTGTGPLQSTTGVNGFLSLPSDLYNTPYPSTGPVLMDASVASPQINIPATGSVLLRFEQHYRFCCTSFPDLVVELSTDGINWTSIDMTLGRSLGNVYSNPELMEFDVSSTLGNQTTAYIRFRQTGGTHYFFMVDDLALVEGYSNALELTDFAIGFGSTHSINPVYTQIPQVAMPQNINFEVEGQNVGGNTLTGVQAKLEVFHDSTLGGAFGVGLFNSMIDSSVNPLLNLDRDTFNLNSSSLNIEGYFRFKISVESDSINEIPAAASDEFSFVVSDTVLARDRNNFTANTGPGNFWGSNGVGDKWGVLYDFFNNQFGSSGILGSISIYIANDTQNINVGIRPRVWRFDDSKSTLDSAILDPPIGSSPFTTVINPSMLGKWTSIPLFPPMLLSAGEQYVVGWEQISGSNSLSMGRDVSVEEFSPSVSNFVYINDATPSWGWVTAVAGVRLNLTPPIVGLEELNESESNLFIFPNPSLGQFSIRYKPVVSDQYTLRIRNILGQVIFKEQVLVGDIFAKDIDFSDQKTGIYFVSLENETERIVEKLIVQ